jgi:hypothetical protein
MDIAGLRWFSVMVLVVVGATACGGASPGAAGLDDRDFPALGNGGYDATHYLLDLSIDVEQNRLDGW